MVASLSKKAIEYPLPYVIWKKKPRDTISGDQTLDQVKAVTSQIHMNAYPVAALESPWIILPPQVRKKTVDKVQKGVAPGAAMVYSGWKS
jgi:hypothetical protein